MRALLALSALLLVSSAAFADEPTPCGSKPADMACIPAGPFLRGSMKGWKDERPQETVELDAYFMDLNEVTYPDYQDCVKAKACRKGGPNYPHFNGPKQPINGIQWFGAVEFCQWKGKRLPTEAEWEKAARGTDGRTYPWGEEKATCARAIIKEGEPNGCGKGIVWDVGSRPPNPYGLFDMAGNSWEWVQDWYSPSYAACGKDCQGKNPKGPCGGALTCKGHEERIVRGGSWYWDGAYCTTTKRRSHHPGNTPFHHFGFRCAKDAAVEVEAGH